MTEANVCVQDQVDAVVGDWLKVVRLPNGSTALHASCKGCDRGELGPQVHLHDNDRVWIECIPLAVVKANRLRQDSGEAVFSAGIGGVGSRRESSFAFETGSPVQPVRCVHASDLAVPGVRIKVLELASVAVEAATSIEVLTAFAN
ncbi:MAG: hypothetical protein KC877_01795 [Candidatus Kaiserbacteria bacterium]|nr:hypothetical protein [Candidatus Kaiserbacteria bacterium]MCB9815917.1 hypothetical protein [Candidatus Nomurabacteria bacterium]